MDAQITTAASGPLRAQSINEGSPSNLVNMKDSFWHYNRLNTGIVASPHSRKATVTDIGAYKQMLRQSKPLINPEIMNDLLSEKINKCIEAPMPNALYILLIQIGCNAAQMFEKSYGSAPKQENQSFTLTTAMIRKDTLQIMRDIKLSVMVSDNANEAKKMQLYEVEETRKIITERFDKIEMQKQLELKKPIHPHWGGWFG